jgi:Protein of unknown function (DUF4235)
MADVKDRVGWKVIALAATIAAGQATHRTAEKIYQARIGEPAPDSPSSPRVPLRIAVIWAISSGAVGELVGLLIQRAAAHGWEAATGELPPGLEPEPDDDTEDAAASSSDVGSD